MNSFEISAVNINNDCYKKFNGIRQIDYLIFHHIQCNNLNEAIDALEYHGVSAHFVVTEDGEITQLVEENDIAFHAGVSYWNGIKGLNASSIGIEFLNSSPFEKIFSEEQLQSGLKLATYLKNKYKIANRFILGHSDIAFDSQTNLLNRKQDPSHLFNWEFFALNDIGLYPEFDNREEFNELYFAIEDKSPKILEIKEKLAYFGYKIENFDENFDEEMQNLAIVFNRHFNNKSNVENHNLWLKTSDYALNYLLNLI